MDDLFMLECGRVDNVRGVCYHPGVRVNYTISGEAPRTTHLSKGHDPLSDDSCIKLDVPYFPSQAVPWHSPIPKVLVQPLGGVTRCPAPTP
jgi:hypothetical protein